MKENLDLVEKLVEKTGISYTEAKAVLEKSDWDILDAIINLEAQGKVRGPASYSTRSEGGSYEANEKGTYEHRKTEKKKRPVNEEFKKSTVGVLEWMRSIFDKGNTNNLEAYKNGNKVLGMPVTVFVLLLIVGFYVVIPLIIVSLFFGFRYRFSGPELGKDKLNDAVGKATDVADNIKQEFKSKD